MTFISPENKTSNYLIILRRNFEHYQSVGELLYKMASIAMQLNVVAWVQSSPGEKVIRIFILFYTIVKGAMVLCWTSIPSLSICIFISEW